jgi:hypothetical protein
MTSHDVSTLYQLHAPPTRVIGTNPSRQVIRSRVEAIYTRRGDTR